MPNNTAPTSHTEKPLAITNSAIPIDCTHIPVAIIHLRPQRSLNAPVMSWLTLHMPGYAAAIKATCSTDKPAPISRMGTNPHTMPSFMLLTIPAWLTENKFRFFQLVNQNISRNDGFEPELERSRSDCDTEACASCFACACVSWTKKTDRISPDKANAMPGKNGAGRSP